MEAKFLISGDSAISVQMGSEISLEVNQLVRMLFLDLTKNPIEGIVEMVPTYASLMVHYRPEKIRYDQLKEEIERRLLSMWRRNPILSRRYPSATAESWDRILRTALLMKMYPLKNSSACIPGTNTIRIC